MRGNGHDAAFFKIVIHQHGLLSTFAVAWLFLSPGRIPYTIFEVVEELFGAIYFEMEVVSLYYWAMRWWWWWETTGNIFSGMVSQIQIFSMYIIWLTTCPKQYLVHADNLVYLIYCRHLYDLYSWLAWWNHREDNF